MNRRKKRFHRKLRKLIRFSEESQFLAARDLLILTDIALRLGLAEESRNRVARYLAFESPASHLFEVEPDLRTWKTANTKPC